jgi:hypothetical protein
LQLLLPFPRGQRTLHLLGAAGEHRRAVLLTDVKALMANLRRVVDLPEGGNLGSSPASARPSGEALS